MEVPDERADDDCSERWESILETPEGVPWQTVKTRMNAAKSGILSGLTLFAKYILQGLKIIII